MKQKNIIIGNMYTLIAMQHKKKPELNGIKVKIVEKKKGATDHNGVFPNVRRTKPTHYLTNLGFYVMACNLEQHPSIKNGGRRVPGEVV